MKANYLLPHPFKKAGWLLFIPGIILGLLWIIFLQDLQSFDKLRFFELRVPAIVTDVGINDLRYFTITETNILVTIIGILIISGGIFIAFSKEEKEDEYIAEIRLGSLLWATYVSYGIVLLTFLFVYGLVFYWVLVFNLFTLLLFFIIRFNWLLISLRKEDVYEK